MTVNMTWYTDKILPGPFFSLHLLDHIFPTYNLACSSLMALSPLPELAWASSKGRPSSSFYQGKTMLLVFATLDLAGDQGATVCREGREKVELELGDTSQEVHALWMHDAPFSAGWNWGGGSKGGSIAGWVLMSLLLCSGTGHDPRVLNLKLAFSFPD